jgi:hypothetical protein
VGGDGWARRVRGGAAAPPPPPATLLDEALTALVPLGPPAEPLRALAHYVLARKK